MPSVFFVSPFEPPHWDPEATLHIDVDRYLNQLSARWPDLTIVTNPVSPTYIAYWQLPISHSQYFEGGLQKGASVVSCQGRANGIAEFVLWHRQFIESQYRLFLFDDGLHVIMNIVPEMTPQEIKRRIQG
jgi:hypothetical protein